MRRLLTCVNFAGWLPRMAVLSLGALLLTACALLEPGRSVTLEWSAPAGEQSLAGYRIYYWRDNDGGRRSIDVPNPRSDRFRIRRLSPGTYHFALTAYDVNGSESLLSNVLSKTLR